MDQFRSERKFFPLTRACSLLLVAEQRPVATLTTALVSRQRPLARPVPLARRLTATGDRFAGRLVGRTSSRRLARKAARTYTVASDAPLDTLRTP